MVHEDVYKRTLAHLHKTHTLIETACSGIVLVDKQPGWFSTLAGPLYHGSVNVTRDRAHETDY